MDIIPSSFALTPKIMGLTIDQETGAISGNVTDEVGNYDVEVEMCAEDLCITTILLITVISTTEIIFRTALSE